MAAVLVVVTLGVGVGVMNKEINYNTRKNFLKCWKHSYLFEDVIIFYISP
jgi:hypothetical protein